LTRGSPERETTINFVLGTGQYGNEKKMSISSYQGLREPHFNVRRSRDKLNVSSNDV